MIHSKNAFVVDENTLFYIIPDDHNENRNKELYSAVCEYLPMTDNPDEADCYVVIGGDGTLLNAVRDYARKEKSLPILPLNGGTVGKNLIDVSPENFRIFALAIMSNQCTTVEFPMLSTISTEENGEKEVFYSFNDSWIDRKESQSVKYSIEIIDNNFPDHPIFLGDEQNISGDGILFATPAGSTGYSRMLGEMVLPLQGNTVLISPMSSMIDKRKVHSFAINEDQALKIRFYDIDFRPTRLAIDGKYLLSNVKEIEVRLASKEHNVKLLTDRPSRFMEKQIQFIAH
jgi:NAD+ kinase